MESRGTVPLKEQHFRETNNTIDKKAELYFRLKFNPISRSNTYLTASVVKKNL